MPPQVQERALTMAKSFTSDHPDPQEQIHGEAHRAYPNDCT